MTSFWLAELWRVALFLVPAWFIGMLLGIPSQAVMLAFVLYTSVHLRNIYRLYKWLNDSRTFVPPEASGIWGGIFDLLYRSQLRNRKRKKRLAGIVNRFQQATSALPDATVVLGAYDEIMWVNEAAKHMLGLRTGADTGQRIDNLLRHPDFITFLDGELDADAVEIPSPVQPQMILNIRLVPYGKDQRLLVARDVSQRKSLDRVRRDFVANVSHELRTPLTVLHGFIETMLDDEVPEHWQNPLTLMESQTRRMQQIVADLLLLSRLESSEQKIRMDMVDVPRILEEMSSSMGPVLEEKHQTLSLKLDSQLQIQGMESELFSAFSNLVANAVRYTPDGGHIEMQWYQDEQGIHMAVEDNGIGIEPEHIPRLTERFYRVDVGRSRQVGGTGLGLAIVKHVLHRHQGKLTIQSTPDKGSRFICDFPLSGGQQKDNGEPPMVDMA